MNERLGVDPTVARSDVRADRSTTCWRHEASSSMIEWKYTNGSCRDAYWSPTLAAWVESAELIAGWRHGVCMSSM